MVQKNLSLLAQLDGQQLSEPGQISHNLAALCMQSDGLLALATGMEASVVLDVLQDDMSLNLKQALQQSGGVSLCLQESLDNIDEFLSQRQLHSGVDLAVVQLGQNHFSAFVCGQLRVARFHDDQLDMLSSSGDQPCLVGQAADLKRQFVEQRYYSGDIFLLASQALFAVLDKDFIRLTFSRFSDNLQMVLRQFNTRAQRNGLANKSSLVLCRIDKQDAAPAKGWFARLRQ